MGNSQMEGNIHGKKIIVSSLLVWLLSGDDSSNVK